MLVRIAVPHSTSSGGTHRRAPKIMSEPENQIKRDAHVKITWGDSSSSYMDACVCMYVFVKGARKCFVPYLIFGAFFVYFLLFMDMNCENEEAALCEAFVSWK